jgi:phage shock protein A
MSDILTKIRCTVPCQVQDAKSGCHCAEARDTITALRAEVERLRSCLAKQPNTYMIAYENGRNRQLARAACELQDKLEQRDAENERLRAALERIEKQPPDTAGNWEMRKLARAALEEKPARTPAQKAWDTATEELADIESIAAALEEKP